MDLCLTEYRVAGGDVSSVESVVVEDKGERLEASSVSTAKFVPCSRRNVTRRFLR